MSARFVFRHVAVWFALLGTLSPPRVAATEPARAPRVVTHDVCLDARGRLHGVVVNGQGQAQVAATVTLGRTDRPGPRQSLRTGGEGQFCFEDVKAGTYQLETSEGVCLCRLWTSTAAPPAAAKSLLVVNDAQITRGQRPIGELFRSDAVLMATVVAAAIAIPIAVHKSKSKDAEGS